MRRLLSILLIGCVAPLSSAQTTKHPYTFDDIALMSSASAVAMSPAGEVLYAAGSGAQRGRSSNQWHLIKLDGTNDRKVNLPAGFSPQGFTADGDLFGSYAVGGQPQLAIFAPNVNEKSVPKSMIFAPTGVGSATISPDGTRFAILANPVPAPDDSSTKTVVRPDQTSLYVVGADGKGGKWWAPEITNVNTIAWSLDSKSIAVLSSTPKIGFHYVKSMIEVVDESGTRHVTTIDNAVNGIAWSKDGIDLVFLCTNTSVLTPDHVWSVPVAGGTPIDRTPTLAASAMSLSGDARGNIWVGVDRGVVGEIDKFEGNGLAPAVTYPAGGVFGILYPQTGNGTDKIAFNVQDPTHSGNIGVLDGGSVKRITHEGDDLLAQVDLGPVSVIHWTGKDGTKLEGIATFPAGFTQGKKYPFIVVPHGGPEGNDILGVEWFSRFFAGLGYVVIQPQYRGSTGYGSDFLNAIYQHFGDRAYQDVDSATDFAIQQGWADPNRLAIMGWSAGGFMTSWTVTQTNRYKAAIEGAGITDWGSFIWTSDVQQIDYDARWPGKEPQYFQQFSAVNFADRVTTPLLILHGAADRRVPTFQGQEYYEALVANGKTARMVTYPGSGHFPSLWEQRHDLFNEMAAWLKQYNR